MRAPFILFFYFIILSPIFSQSSFSITIVDQERQGVSGQIESKKGNYLLYYSKNGYQNQIQDIKGYIFQINDVGDTSSLALNSGDTIRYIRGMTKTSANELIAICNQLDPPYTTTKLMILKLDSNLNTIWRKSFQLNGYGIFLSLDVLRKSDEMIYLVGSIYMDNNPSLTKPFLIKINSLGDTLITKYLPSGSIAGFSNSVFSSDSSRIWMFGGGYGTISGACRLETDTNFNILNVTSLGGNSYGTVSIPLMGRQYNNDSVLLFGSYLRDFNHPTDIDLGISKRDTALQPAPIHYFGAPDTVDYPADGLGLDFIGSDSVFYAGTHNIIPFYWAGGVSWIITGMLDRNLNPRYEHYYGGDAYYRCMFITATLDGGSLITAAKHYPFTEDEDIWILKLTPDGVLTSSRNLDADTFKKALVYPNPGKDHFCIRTGLKHAILNLYDVNGVQAMSNLILPGINSIECKSLPKGLYIYKIVVGDQVIETGIWTRN